MTFSFDDITCRQKNRFGQMFFVNYDLLYELLSYINMQRIQNLQKFNKNPSKDHTKIMEESVLTNTQDKKQKSLPKFNRKGDVRLNQKKKSIDLPADQQRIVYISPGKKLGIQNLSHYSSTIQSPKLSDVIHRFSIANEDAFKFPKKRAMTNRNNTELDQNDCQSERCQKIIQQKDNKIKALKTKIQKLNEEKHYQQECNQLLKVKLSECQSIQVFLLQRQTFISQILENNIKLNQSLLKNEEEKKSLQERYESILQEKNQLKQQLDCKLLELTLKAKIQDGEIEKYIQITQKLQSQLAQKNKKHKKSNKRQKQNNEKLIQSPTQKSRKTNIFDSKHYNDLSESIHAQFTPHDLNTTQKSSEKDEMVIKLDQITPSRPSHQDTDQNIFISNDILSSDHNKLHHENKLIKNLQQKIRYSEIEIDVLKKIKLDSLKINEDNESLKWQNRKLLNRISYLTRTFSRKGNYSDSSLQLSLSPKRQ